MKSLWGDRNQYLRIRSRRIDVSRKFARLLIGGVLILIFMIFTAGDTGFINMWKAHGKLENIESRIEILKNSNNQLQEKITSLKNDPFAIEKVAREEYGYIRPGDRVLRLNVLPRKERSEPESSLLDIGEDNK
ncbi:MAG: septum formation initiator family protein [Candidatus Krumholzibacteriales bacterium]